MIKKAIKHFNTVTKHKWIVFKLCFKCGLVWQGLTHDLSKYSPTEFLESIKYYTGDKSPNANCIKDKGYSNAWLHHKGRNKHHHEYWYDYYGGVKTPIIPYKYVAEMICDNVAASIMYNGKNWDNSMQYNYWLKRIDKFMINDKIKDILMEAFKEISEQGVDKTITKSNLLFLYNKYTKENAL